MESRFVLLVRGRIVRRIVSVSPFPLKSFGVRRLIYRLRCLFSAVVIMNYRKSLLNAIVVFLTALTVAAGCCKTNSAVSPSADGDEGNVTAEQSEETAKKPVKRSLDEIALHYFGKSKIERFEKAFQSGDVDASNFGDEVLHYAAMTGDLDRVKLLVNRGADVYSIGKWNRTELHFAAQSGNLKLVEFLVKQGLNVNASDDPLNQTVLHFAAQSGNLALVEYLVKQGADLFVTDVSECTVLYDAVLSGNTELVQWLIKQGLDFNPSDDWVVLFFAVQSGSLEMLDWLIQDGMNVNAINEQGETVLHYAAGKGDLELVKRLVSHGANVYVTGEDGWSVLHYAARSGNLELVQWLIEQGLNLYETDDSNLTILYNAARSGNLELVEWLLNQGLDVNEKDFFENPTVLYSAARSGNLKLVERLIERGADVKDRDDLMKFILNAPLIDYSEQYCQKLIEWWWKDGSKVNVKDFNGRTALNLLVKKELSLVDADTLDDSESVYVNSIGQNSSLERVKYLIEHGADVNNQDRFGWSALQSAAYNDDRDMVQYLVEQGADVNAKSNLEKTALHYAAQNGNLKLVQYLIEHGADVNANASAFCRSKR